MKVTAQIDIVGGSHTAEEIIAALSQVPKDALVSIKTHDGDRGSDWHTIEATWTAEQKKPTPTFHTR